MRNILLFIVGLILILKSNILIADESISAGDIAINELRQVDSKVDYYKLRHPCSTQEISIRLFGHIYSSTAQAAPYLKHPCLCLDHKMRNDSHDIWRQICDAQPPISTVHVAQIENFTVDEDYDYRIGVHSLSSESGRYALIVDPVIDGCEIEMEHLDLGNDPRGRQESLSTAYVVRDDSLPCGARVYVGTELGYLLVSEDDAQTWKRIYPPGGETPHGSIYGLFVDSQGIIYVSQWTSCYDVNDKSKHGHLYESRDDGKTWSAAIKFLWPTGVAWRICEDDLGNVFVGEYAATWPVKETLDYTGNIWRRKNHGDNGEQFETVFRNPSYNDVKGDSGIIYSWVNNHIHFIDIDPYTGFVYATIGDGIVGRFVRSKHNGDPGTWETLETGTDAHYTSITFTPDFLFLGQDTNKQYKKMVCWDKSKNCVSYNEPFWTTNMMDNPTQPPASYHDKGNWFWSYFFPKQNLLIAQYLPYGMETFANGQKQTPRLYATNDLGNTWRRAITFPPVPHTEQPQSGFWGPKLASNIGPNGWIYAMRGTVSQEIHRGFRFRLKPNSSGLNENWKNIK